MHGLPPAPLQLWRVIDVFSHLLRHWRAHQARIAAAVGKHDVCVALSLERPLLRGQRRRHGVDETARQALAEWRLLRTLSRPPSLRRDQTIWRIAAAAAGNVSAMTVPYVINDCASPTRAGRLVAYLLRYWRGGSHGGSREARRRPCERHNAQHAAAPPGIPGRRRRTGAERACPTTWNCNLPPPAEPARCSVALRGTRAWPGRASFELGWPSGGRPSQAHAQGLRMPPPTHTRQQAGL